jgi:hypothetical protein
MDQQTHPPRKSPFGAALDSPEWKAHIESIRKLEAERKEKIRNHPDNGKEGWWIVQGIRHSAHARASSAAEAIEKAEKANIVQDWELPDAHFWTKELPDVF